MTVVHVRCKTLNIAKDNLVIKGKGITFYIALLDQVVSVALYNLTSITLPWYEPSP